MKSVRGTGDLTPVLSNRRPDQKHSIPERVRELVEEGSSGQPSIFMLCMKRAQCRGRQDTWGKIGKSREKKNQRFS